MSIRHEARERAAQFLFQMDFNKEELPDALKVFWEQVEEGRKPVLSFAEQLIYGVDKNVHEIDEKILSCMDNWKLNRLGGVDRNVLRMATYEMLFCDDIPPVVSINEAVDVARDLSNLESSRFVNGVLDKIRKTIDRPARKPVNKKKRGANG